MMNTPDAQRFAAVIISILDAVAAGILPATKYAGFTMHGLTPEQLLTIADNHGTLIRWRDENGDPLGYGCTHINPGADILPAGYVVSVALFTTQPNNHATELFEAHNRECIIDKKEA